MFSNDKNINESAPLHNLALILISGCQLRLKEEEAIISSRDFPQTSGGECQVWFPSHGTGHSLVIELTRLNVPCSRGYVHFSGLNVSQHPHFRSHRQAHLCGKLEELPESDRHVYFPFSHTPPVMHTHGNPVFTLSYHLVDYCYNVTFVARNGSFELKPTGELQCTFKIYLPYGNRVALNLQIGDSTSTGEHSADEVTRNWNISRRAFRKDDPEGSNPLGLDLDLFQIMQFQAN
ncbi:hypothetical protein GEV33_005911 [Tenebrio molitor]|uniref:Uncharacterized protein n=1 Tax=Tenebrio molitor TaxID=7067 RepID=A0A8J6HDM4_TENMO|nr:hypothetical protein GEV33_005911 [Tenebrio molitor]